MLREPELSIVQAFFDAGGRVLQVPFGISGRAFGFREMSTIIGMRGWVQRFGIRHVPQESLPFIMAGQLSVPAARAELVWDLVRANNNRATISALAKALGLSPPSIGVVLEFLQSIGAVMRDDRARPARFCANDPQPDWRLYLKTERRVA